jgi:hypothetical protein
MAKKSTGASNRGAKLTLNRQGTKKRTSIGQSKMSKPKNKRVRASFKKYRGQGRTR